jgi:hypothetical protein
MRPTFREVPAFYSKEPTMPETYKEAIYDDQINPLMAQILDICKTHKIPMVCSFALGTPPGGESQLCCTSALLSDDFEPTKPQLAAFNLFQHGFAAFTITRR